MWSATKKKLESLTCSSLKNRVRFFVTNYTDAHDQCGRACILVDDKEMYNMCNYKYQVETYDIVQKLINDENYIPKYESEYSANYEAEEMAAISNIYGSWHFFEALISYFNNPIGESLHSDNEIIKSLALIDRRVGKRTLRKLSEMMDSQTDMVKYFYRLRCDADGMSQAFHEKEPAHA